MTCRWRNFASSLNEFLTKQRSRVPSTFLEAMSSRREKGREERKKKERQDDFKLKNCYPVWYGWLLFVVNVCVCVCVRLCFFVLQPFWLLNWLDGCSSLRSLPPPSERKKMVSCSRDVRKEREKDLRQMIFLSVVSGARAFPGVYMIQDDWPPQRDGES